MEQALDLFGRLLPSKRVRAEVTDVSPGALTYLAYGPGTAFVGLGPLTLVPLPGTFLRLGAGPASGAFTLEPAWPAAAVLDQSIALQALVVDLGVAGFLAASNGVSGIGGV